jgi:sugar/nucleoside kinase (ribokinase family)
MTILAVGSIALDTIHTPSGEAEEILGGSLTYFALAASRFASVRLVSAVGEDFSGESMEVFGRAGIDTTGLERLPGRTFRWTGRYLEDMNRRETLSLDLNVFGEFDPEIPQALRDTPFVFLANGSPVLQKKVLGQVSDCRFSLLDTMDHWIETEGEALREVLGEVDGLVINDEEARQLSGERNLITAGNRILEMGPKIVVVKKGEHGAFLFSTYLHYALPAFPIENVVDPTGAGDTFAGGLMGFLARSGRVTIARIKKAMIYGTVMASFCVEKFGPNRLLEVSDEEIADRYEDFVQFTAA